MPSRDKSPGVKIPALKFRASNIFCVKRVPPKKTTKSNLSKVKSVFEIRIDVPNQDRMFQIRIGCSKCKLRLKFLWCSTLD